MAPDGRRGREYRCPSRLYDERKEFGSWINTNPSCFQIGGREPSATPCSDGSGTKSKRRHIGRRGIEGRVCDTAGAVGDIRHHRF